MSGFAGTDSSKLCFSHIAALTSPNVPGWKSRKAQTLCTCVNVTSGLSSCLLFSAWRSLCCTAAVFVTSNNSMRFSKPRWAF